MRIYEAIVDDLKDIIPFTKAFERESEFVKVDIEHTINKYRELMECGIGHLFVLENSQKKIIGCLGCIKVEDIHTPRINAVETGWFVDPIYRGWGIGLLRYFEKWAERNGCNHVVMTHMVDSMPDSLEKLYLRRGYSLIEKNYAKEIK